VKKIETPEVDFDAQQALIWSELSSSHRTQEIGGMLLGKYTPEGVIEVERIAYPEQVCSGGEVEFDDESLNFEIAKGVRDGLAHLGWIHKHPGESKPMPSTDDWETQDKFSEGAEEPKLMFITNAIGDFKKAYFGVTFRTPWGWFAGEASVAMAFDSGLLPDEKLFKKKVNVVTTGRFNTGTPTGPYEVSDYYGWYQSRQDVFDEEKRKLLKSNLARVYKVGKSAKGTVADAFEKLANETGFKWDEVRNLKLAFMAVCGIECAANDYSSTSDLVYLIKPIAVPARWRQLSVNQAKGILTAAINDIKKETTGAQEGVKS
jgi:hypothetical protein